MAERMIIEPVERIEENYLETRNKVEVQGYGANRYFISSKEYTLADYMRAVQNNSEKL